MTIAQRYPEFAALSAHGDAHVTPGTFEASGTLSDVLKQWSDAIDAERHENITVRPSVLAFGPTSGALTLDGGQTTRYGYTKRAVRQLFERTHSGVKSSMPIGAMVDSFLWVRSPSRASLWSTEILARGNQARTVVLRVASDAHNKKEDRRAARYVRGLVSEAHSREMGDDAVVLRSIREVIATARVTNSESHIAPLLAGKAFVRREPADKTHLYVLSALAERMGARLAFNVVNSEVGSSSARCYLSVALSCEIDGVRQTRFVSVSGARSEIRAGHKGSGVAHMFEAFVSETLPMAQVRADATLALLNDERESAPLAERFSDVDIEKFTLAETIETAVLAIGVSKGSALAELFVDAFMGEGERASRDFSKAFLRA